MSSIRLRYVVQVPASKPCDQCAKSHVVYEWALLDGTRIAHPEEGDVFFSVPHDGACTTWDNCEGRHLFVIVPEGHWWNIDGRASNCTMKDDRTHRCWVRHGDPTRPETLHVDKNGDTCSAGAGSILAGDYHGFLHNGQLVKC